MKGDVHDIGKNLVEIILSNNGYTVINLGIKVPPEDLIKAFREHHPDAIGLSGLLVKSAHQMVITGGDLKDNGVGVPLLVGGAALSEKFTKTKIGPSYASPTFYAKDAMTGLRLLNEIMDPATQRTSPGVATSSAKANQRPRPVPSPQPPAPRRGAPKSGPISPFHPRRTQTGGCATFQIWRKCGATSIRSCSTGGIWDSKATSRNYWPNATRKR